MNEKKMKKQNNREKKVRRDRPTYFLKLNFVLVMPDGVSGKRLCKGREGKGIYGPFLELSFTHLLLFLLEKERQLGTTQRLSIEKERKETERTGRRPSKPFWRLPSVPFGWGERNRSLLKGKIRKNCRNEA